MENCAILSFPQPFRIDCKRGVEESINHSACQKKKISPRRWIDRTCPTYCVQLAVWSKRMKRQVICLPFFLLFYGILWRNAILFGLDGWGELYTSITPQKKGLEDGNSGRKVDFFAVMAALCEGARFLGFASLHVPETHHNEECLERNSSDFAGS